MNIGNKVWIKGEYDDDPPWLPGDIINIINDNNTIKYEININNNHEYNQILQLKNNNLKRIIEINNNNNNDNNNNKIYMRNTLDQGNINEDENINDLTKLTYLYEPNIIYTLRKRYDHEMIYTDIGSNILIAINPFWNIPIYSANILNEYKKSGEMKALGAFNLIEEDNNQLFDTSLDPHAFNIADQAYRSIISPVSLTTSGNQSILVSGDSGSGKTETAKIIMQYLAAVGANPKTSLYPNNNEINININNNNNNININNNMNMNDKKKRRLSFRAKPRKSQLLNIDENKPILQRRDSIMFKSDSIERQVIECNPILEAFGNARTIRNNNSSRYGRYIQLYFNWPNGYLNGSKIDTFLLEKVRIVSPGYNERNFHIFYLILKGAEENEIERWYLKEPEYYNYLNQTDCYERQDGINDANEYNILKSSLNIMGFSFTKQEQIFSLISVLLLLGNIEFTDHQEEINKKDDDIINRKSSLENINENNIYSSSSISGNSEDQSFIKGSSYNIIEKIITILQISSTKLINSLTSRIIKVNREIVHVALNPQQALHARDALVKAIYSELFNHIINNLNIFMKKNNLKIITSDSNHNNNSKRKSLRKSIIAINNNDDDIISPFSLNNNNNNNNDIENGKKSNSNINKAHFIGILDIFGFETFEYNSMEQLLINYANEALQNQFNQYIFDNEQIEYEKENIQWNFINYNDNNLCLELISGKKNSIMALLNEQMMIPMGNDNGLLNKIYKKLGDHNYIFIDNKLKGKHLFGIKHYAETVIYHIEGQYNEYGGFLEKNRDHIPQLGIDLLCESHNSLVRTLGLNLNKEQNEDKNENKRNSRSNRKSYITQSSLMTSFKTQLNLLIHNIEQTNVSYIRCIKPNDDNIPGKCDLKKIERQLINGGVIKAVDIVNSGYQIRILFDDFIDRYKCIITYYNSIHNNINDENDVINFNNDYNKDIIEKFMNIFNNNYNNSNNNILSYNENDIQIGINKIFLRQNIYLYYEYIRSKSLIYYTKKLQTFIRCYIKYKKYNKLKKNIILIQSYYRSYNIRNILYQKKILNNCIIIQKYIRKWLLIKKYRNILYNIKLIQKNYNIYKRNKLNKIILNNNNAIIIQKYIRKWLLFKKFKNIIHNIIIIQNIYRKKKAYNIYKLKIKEKNDVNKLNNELTRLKELLKKEEMKRKSMEKETELLKRNIIINNKNNIDVDVDVDIKKDINENKKDDNIINIKKHVVDIIDIIKDVNDDLNEDVNEKEYSDNDNDSDIDDDIFIKNNIDNNNIIFENNYEKNEIKENNKMIPKKKRHKGPISIPQTNITINNDNNNDDNNDRIKIKKKQIDVKNRSKDTRDDGSRRPSIWDYLTTRTGKRKMPDAPKRGLSITDAILSAIGKTRQETGTTTPPREEHTLLTSKDNKLPFKRKKSRRLSAEECSYSIMIEINKSHIKMTEIEFKINLHKEGTDPIILYRTYNDFIWLKETLSPTINFLTDIPTESDDISMYLTDHVEIIALLQEFLLVLISGVPQFISMAIKGNIPLFALQQLTADEAEVVQSLNLFLDPTIEKLTENDDDYDEYDDEIRYETSDDDNDNNNDDNNDDNDDDDDETKLDKNENDKIDNEEHSIFEPILDWFS